MNDQDTNIRIGTVYGDKYQNLEEAQKASTHGLVQHLARAIKSAIERDVLIVDQNGIVCFPGETYVLPVSNRRVVQTPPMRMPLIPGRKSHQANV